MSDTLQSKYSGDWSRLSHREGTGELIIRLELYLEKLLSAFELTNQNQDSPSSYNVITDNIGRSTSLCQSYSVYFSCLVIWIMNATLMNIGNTSILFYFFSDVFSSSLKFIK